jgi:hypothetical protein
MSPSNTTEAEKAMTSWGIAYEKEPDGKIRVRGNLDVAGHELTALPDFSDVVVEGDFCCGYNLLTSLKGSPRVVGGSFYCFNNRLQSLEHAPPSIGGEFYCDCNQLASLEGVPVNFTMLVSDLGEFQCWDDIPLELRFSPETRARQQENSLEDATVLHAPLKVRPPLKFSPKK